MTKSPAESWNGPVDVTKLGDRLYMIDAHMEGMTNRLSCYLYDTSEPLIVDAGPSTSFEHLVSVLDHLGIDEIATVLVTHVHIDHGGAAGHFAQKYPDARIAVHHLGAPHLARPARLWDSTARIYGAEALKAKWGEMLPIDESRLDALYEGDTVSAGSGIELQILDTPGHAKHHVTIFDPETGAMFVGDAAGLCYPHGHPVQPNTPPPDFDPHLVTGTLRRMAALDPAFVGFAHFGPRRDAQAALEESEQRVWDWVELIERDRNLSVEDSTSAVRLATLQLYRDSGLSDDDIEFLDRAAGSWDMHVNGVRRWLDKRDQAPAAGA